MLRLPLWVLLLSIVVLHSRRAQLKHGVLTAHEGPKGPKAPGYVERFLGKARNLMELRNTIRQNSKAEGSGTVYLRADRFNDNIRETPGRRKYRLSNGFVYKLDKYHRVVRVTGKLRKRPEREESIDQTKRIRGSNQKYCQALANLEIIHAGHLIGHQFMHNFKGRFKDEPCRDSLNFLPMHPTFNQKYYGNMESYLNYLTTRSDVHVKLTISYERNDPKDSFFAYPSKFDVALTPKSFLSSVLVIWFLFRTVFRVTLFNPLPNKNDFEEPIYSKNWPQMRKLKDKS